MSKAAMELALDALKTVYTDEFGVGRYDADKCNAAIAALEEAIKQAKREAVSYTGEKWWLI